ncbi:MAG: LytTR family transcriptional regulator [Hyphomicrobiaceae bacterium]|nr:LytTR family transcriptional regulator [Hyphomicrobiaceae bacterium]MCC0024004.1 LytTR family transcriptional regulator [Hyphomicrobiaceae bacterium]
MTDRPLQSAIRELQRLGRDPRTLGAMAFAILVLGFSGPFQTFELLPIGPRFAYWTFICVLTFSAGAFFGTWTVEALNARKLPLAAQIGGAGLGAGIPASIIVVLINWLTFGDEMLNWQETWPVPVFTLIISTAVSGLFALFARHGNAARVSEPEVKPVRLLERLPQHKRGKLISMSVSDHYVAITTDRGKELVLMRFRDAMAECEGCEGVQIHRSHWIALNQITNVLRLDGKTLIETSAGERLPVSRSFAETLKERGVI